MVFALGPGDPGFLSSVGRTVFKTGTGADITSSRVDSTIKQIESGLSTRRILNRIEDITDRNLLQSTQFQFENIFTPLAGLGEASKTISDALNEQIIIREQQRSADNEALQNQAIALGQVNERLSSQVTELGKSLGDIGSGANPLKFLTDNPLIGGIGIGGLAVGGIVLLLLLRR